MMTLLSKPNGKSKQREKSLMISQQNTVKLVKPKTHGLCNSRYTNGAKKTAPVYSEIIIGT